MAVISAAMVKELRERTGLGLLDCRKALTENEGNIEKAIERLRKSSGMKAAKKAGRTAAEGIAMCKISEDGKFGLMIEVNSETDFSARDDGFRAFARLVMDQAFSSKQTDVASLMVGDLEVAREALIQKIGENISVRRIVAVSADEGVVASYIHADGRISVLVALKGGDQELGKDIAMHVAALNPLVVNPADVPNEIIAKERDIYTVQAQNTGKPVEIVEKMIDGRVRKYLAEISLTEQAFVKDPDVKIGALAKKGGAEITSFIRYEVGEGIEKEVVDFAAEVAAQVAM